MFFCFIFCFTNIQSVSDLAWLSETKASPDVMGKIKVALFFIDVYFGTVIL